MTWYPAGAATSEDDGPNWTPPTTGNLMAEQKTKLTRLREAEAHQLVAREARLFHERKAMKYGVNTNRGMAHFKAAMGLGGTREADGRLQEMFAQGGDPSAELPPKAVMKASKAAMQFHQKQAEKHGLNSPVGQAHVAAMQHHQAIHGKAKQQHQQMQQMKMQQQQAQPRSPKVVKPPAQGQPQEHPMMASTEGGPGSGPQGGRHEEVLKQHGFKLRGKNGSDKRYSKGDHHIWVSPSGSWAHEGVGHGKGAESLASHLGSLSATLKKMGKEAAPGHSSKQSPVPVPKKSEQPSEDIRQNKPPVALSPQDANKPGALAKLRQNETMGAHAGMIRAGGPGSGPHAGGGSKAERKEHMKQAFHHFSKGNGAEGQKHLDAAHAISPLSNEEFRHAVRLGTAAGIGNKSQRDRVAGKKESMESRIRNFAREGGRGPYDNQDCTLPSKVKDQMKQNIVFRGKRTDERNKREAGYVAPRYDKSHPEGFVDKRYSDRKSGVEAGWPDRQRHMHRKMAKKSAPRVMESNRQRFPREAPIDLREFYKGETPKRNSGTGWRDGVSFTPTAPKVEREEVNLIIKEF